MPELQVPKRMTIDVSASFQQLEGGCHGV
jgi:hypothetical protein